MKLSKLDKWHLRRIAKKAVIQSPHIDDNLKEYYRIMIEATHNEFREDLPARLDWILEDCFHSTLDERVKTDKYEYNQEQGKRQAY